MNTHNHYEVQAFEEKGEIKDPNMDPKLKKHNYQFGDLVIIDVIADTESEAIKSAKKKLKKKYYRIGKVYECHQLDPEMQQELQVRNTTYLEKIVKELLKMKES